MQNGFFDFEKKGLKYCYYCGKCSSGCEVNRLESSFQPHRILYLLNIGMTDSVIGGDDIWKCTTCFTCSERCPQGVKVTEIIWFARTMAVKSGHLPELIMHQKETLLRTGRLHHISHIDNNKRGKVKLPQLTDASSLISEIFKMTKGDE